jgi:hypothetical protein
MYLGFVMYILYPVFQYHNKTVTVHTDCKQ